MLCGGCVKVHISASLGATFLYMNISSETAPAASAPKTPTWSVIILVIAVLLVAVALVAFLITPVRASIAHTWFFLTAPSEAKKLIVAGAHPGEIGKFQNFALSGREEMVVDVEGLVIDYAERGPVRIASVANPGAMTSELYLLGDGSVQLTEDRYAKTGIAISHDGSRIAYSAPAEKRFMGPYFSLKPEEWTVMVLDLATREIIEVGSGHGPQFVDPNDASKIIYSSAEGLVLHDIDSGVIAVDSLLPPLNAGYPVRISNDGTKMLIFNTEQNRYGIYSIDTATHEHTLYAAIPDTFVSATLTNSHAYWVKKGLDAPSELWSLSLKEGSTPRKIYTFFGGFAVSRVINRP